MEHQVNNTRALSFKFNNYSPNSSWFAVVDDHSKWCGICRYQDTDLWFYKYILLKSRQKTAYGSLQTLVRHGPMLYTKILRKIMTHHWSLSISLATNHHPWNYLLSWDLITKTARTKNYFDCKAKKRTLKSNFKKPWRALTSQHWRCFKWFSDSESGIGWYMI